MALHEQNVRITRPCPVELDPDRARDGKRSWYCGHCEKSVHVLSNMSESEARELLEANVGEDLCVTYAVRRDGSIRFLPEPAPESAVVPITALTRRRRTAAAAAAIGLSAAIAACAPHENPDVAPRGELVVVDAETPTDPVPTIPPANAEPTEAWIDGGIGEIEEPEVPVPGGITVEPLPPADEPCDVEEQVDEPRHPPMRRGGLVRRP